MSIANLVSITPNAEELIAYCARVSNPANQSNAESERLIKYLITHKHWSPFEMAHVVIEVNTTRAIAAQLLRHRSFSFQEFSQRYADVSLMDFATTPDLRRQDTKNRQNSIADLDSDLVFSYQEEIADLYAASESLYKRLLDDGVAKECAREILPLGTPSRLYVSGTVRSWLHYCDLRKANGTQKEHRDIALACIDILRAELPTVCAAMWPSEK
tara:strand:+ start:136 stop:777 length:642 start_codon:yes stop_codon:yes gene_type:complete